MKQIPKEWEVSKMDPSVEDVEMRSPHLRLQETNFWHRIHVPVKMADGFSETTLLLWLWRDCSMCKYVEG